MEAPHKEKGEPPATPPSPVSENGVPTAPRDAAMAAGSPAAAAPGGGAALPVEHCRQGGAGRGRRRQESARWMFHTKPREKPQ